MAGLGLGRWKNMLLCGAVLAGPALAAGMEPAAAPPASPAAYWSNGAPAAPKDAPNVILILLDDVGFGAAGTFGGAIATPTFDALAADGLRYNGFHTTATCSPTRAALLTGRNQHRIGFGVTSGNEQPQPGYSGLWPKSAASIAEVLRANGFSTAAFGKWHNTPNWEASPAGPFDRWPTGLGFDYFYGFLGGEADQWAPILYRNTASVPTPATPGYHFTTDMANDAIGWLHTHQALAPAKPYFLYFAPGATHAPHQVAEEWIRPYRGKFDQGWDRLREEIFARQKRLGVVPRDAVLTPRPAELPAWDGLPADARTLFARQMEVYAGFLAQTDHEIGRMIEAARRGPGGENLLVLYIMGDNGASAEGGLNGSDHNLMDMFGGTASDPVADQLKRADALGSDRLDNHFSAGWAWAADTPFQWTKQIASHLGGTRNPMVIDWPGHIADRGGVRSQFTHAIDVAPTLYQLIGITPPAEVNGVRQMTIDGISFAATLAGNPPEAPRTQYFEMFGNRALYRDGWMASARHSIPWQLSNRATSLEGDRWELYDLRHDYAQAKDLAARYPARLESMRAAFLAEAKRNDVLPMNANIALTAGKPSLEAGRRMFVFHRDTAPIPSLYGAPILMGAHRIETTITVPEQDANGVIVADGARDGGFVLYLKDGYLVYENNAGGRHWDRIRSSGPLPAGKATVRFEAMVEGGKRTGRLSVNGAQVADGSIQAVSPPSYLGAFCVGRNCGTAVGQGYAAPYAFTGEIGEVRIEKR